MSEKVQKFKQERETLNEIILNRDNLNIKRFFGIDSAVYREGSLDNKTKEMLGFVASLVLRCDDCILYHLLQLKELKLTDEQFDEMVSVGLVVGGSITIPHIRRAYKTWYDLSE